MSLQNGAKRDSFRGEGVPYLRPQPGLARGQTSFAQNGNCSMKTRIFQVLHWICRLGLGAIFLYTGYIKIESPLQFAAILSGYQIFPEALIVPLTFYFPWVEIGLGILLLIGWMMRYVSLAACALLASFTAVLTITYARGIQANCGCFSFDDQITIFTIVRDGIIILPAIYLLIYSTLQKRRGSTAAQPVIS